MSSNEVCFEVHTKCFNDRGWVKISTHDSIQDAYDVMYYYIGRRLSNKVQIRKVEVVHNYYEKIP